MTDRKSLAKLVQVSLYKRCFFVEKNKKKSRDFDFQSKSVGISQSRNLHDHEISIGKIANNFKENKLSGSKKKR